MLLVLYFQNFKAFRKHPWIETLDLKKDSELESPVRTFALKEKIHMWCLVFFFPKQWLHWRGSYGRCKGRVRSGYALWPGGFVCVGMPFWDSMLISTAEARTKLPSRFSQFRRRRFTGCSCTFSDMNVISHGRCKESVTCGGQKREFTWQVQGIGHIVKFVAGAVFRGRCQNVGRRVSFEGLRFTWQVQGIRTMDPIFWGQRAQFLRGAAFLQLELEDAFAWPVQYFVWPRLMISWQAQYFLSMVSKCEPSAEIVRVECAECRWNCVFGFRSVTLCGDRVCRVRGMQVKLRFLVSKCNPLLRSCVSSARNAGEIAISDFEVQPSAEIVRVRRAKC